MQTITHTHRQYVCRRQKQKNQEKEKRGKFKEVWFPIVPSLVGAAFQAAVLHCSARAAAAADAAAAAAAWDSCHRYFGVISDRFAKDTRLKSLVYMSLV